MLSEINTNSIGIPYLTGASCFTNNGLLINRWTNAPKNISHKNDLLVTVKGTIGELAFNNIGEVHIARQIMALTINEEIEQKFIFYFLLVNKERMIQKNASLIPGIKRDDILNLEIALPPKEEQKRIIAKIDELLYFEKKITNELKAMRDLSIAVKRKILDFFFGENSSYMSYYEKKYELGQILEYEQPTNYIVNSLDYNSKYSTPVLTAGKTFILGYTNEKCGIYHISKGEKVIIFDDFTTSSHLVDFDFKVKSSAMKILKIIDKKLFDIDYIYFLLQTLDIDTANHKRHWIQKYIPLQLKIHTYDEQKEIVKNIYKLYDVLDSICQS